MSDRFLSADPQKITRNLCIALWTLLFLSITSHNALAHELRPAVVDLVVGDGDTLKVDMQINAEAILAGISPEHDDTKDSPYAAAYERFRALSPQALETNMQTFVPTWLQDQDQPWRFVSIRTETNDDLSVARKSWLSLDMPAPAIGSELALTLPAMPGPIALRIQRGVDIKAESHWIQPGEAFPTISVTEYKRPGFAATMGRYLYLGFIHIVPEGLDHILFVLGLFLLSLQIRPLLWQVTAFTAAHSLTLGLSIYGVIALPARIVEPLIALSIVAIAVENLLHRDLSRWRIAVVTGFGLLHGLGFAGVLQELGMPKDQFLTALLGFNIGVELGQMTVILAAFLAIGIWGRNKDWYRSYVIVPGSIAIAAIGAWWTIDRIIASA